MSSSSNSGRTSLLRQVLAAVVRVLARLRLGYDVPYVVAIVHRHGVRAAWRRLGELRRTMARVEQRFGERDGQLLLAWSAMWHRSSFCAVGHLRAANLAHFELTGELSPLDEALVPELLASRHADARTRFTALCSCEELGSVRSLIERQTALCDGKLRSASEEDELLCAALAAYDGTGRASAVLATPEVIPPLSHRVRDLDLRGRYELARRRERLCAAPLSRVG